MSTNSNNCVPSKVPVKQFAISHAVGANKSVDNHKALTQSLHQMKENSTTDNLKNPCVDSIPINLPTTFDGKSCPILAKDGFCKKGAAKYCPASCGTCKPKNKCSNVEGFSIKNNNLENTMIFIGCLLLIFIISKRLLFR